MRTYVRREALLETLVLVRQRQHVEGHDQFLLLVLDRRLVDARHRFDHAELLRRLLLADRCTASLHNLFQQRTGHHLQRQRVREFVRSFARLTAESDGFGILFESLSGTDRGTPEATATAAAVASVICGGFCVMRWLSCRLPIKYVPIKSTNGAVRASGRGEERSVARTFARQNVRFAFFELEFIVFQQLMRRFGDVHVACIVERENVAVHRNARCRRTHQAFRWIPSCWPA